MLSPAGAALVDGSALNFGLPRFFPALPPRLFSLPLFLSFFFLVLCEPLAGESTSCWDWNLSLGTARPPSKELDAIPELLEILSTFLNAHFSFSFSRRLFFCLTLQVPCRLELPHTHPPVNLEASNELLLPWPR